MLQDTYLGSSILCRTLRLGKLSLSFPPIFYTRRRSRKGGVWWTGDDSGMLGRSGNTAGHHTRSRSKARTSQSRMDGEFRVNDRGGAGCSSRVAVPMRQGLRDGSRFQVQRFRYQFHGRPAGVGGLVHRRWFRRSSRLCSVKKAVLARSRPHLRGGNSFIREK